MKDELEKLGKPQVKRRTNPERRHHLLSLSGGGFRGLYGAEILSGFEKDGNDLRARKRFDLISGTSIGGIIATGLACDIPAKTMSEKFQENGKRIFQKSFGSFNGLTKSRHNQEPLKKTIAEILEDKAKMTLRELGQQTKVNLFITSVDMTNGKLKLFRSYDSEMDRADDISLLDACLATSAAPVFFPPHTIDGTQYVDGGIAANAPDIIAIDEIKIIRNITEPHIHMMSIGTMGQRPISKESPAVNPGAVAWGRKHEIFSLIIGVQEQMVVKSTQALLGASNYFRLDYPPGRDIKLNDTEPQTVSQLMSGAKATLSDIRSHKQNQWRSFVDFRPDVGRT